MNHLKSSIGSKAANSSDNLLKTNISSFMDAIKIMKGIKYADIWLFDSILNSIILKIFTSSVQPTKKTNSPSF